MSFFYSPFLWFDTGKILIATGYDAENQLLPLAFSLVDTENFEDCAWFMQWLRRNVIRSRFVCVITDRGKGIKKCLDKMIWDGMRKTRMSAFTVFVLLI